MRSKRKGTRYTRKARRFVLGFWVTYFLCLGLLILLFISIGYGLLGKIPSFQELENPESNQATEIFSSDGKLLGKYYVENRSNVHYQDLSPNIVNALIATEDARFESHSGIDVKATARMFYGILTGTDRGGGSTITQQLAKNLFPRNPRYTKLELGIMKLKEWVTAVKLERNYSKQEILAMYLNTVDFGSMSFGIKSAAKTYFNKTPDQLNPEEAAMLVGILKAPSYFSPVRNPDNAWTRRNIVLKQMEKYGYISRLEYDSLRESPIDMSNYRIQDHTSGLGTYFREYLRMYLTEWCNSHSKEDGTPYNLYRDGLKIYTTIHTILQEYAEEAVREYLGKELQPSFFSHWKGYPNAPFVFEKNERQEINKLLISAMRRTDRYYRLKKEGYTEQEIYRNFREAVPMKVFSWNGPIDTVLTPLDSIRYYKFFLQAGLMSMDPHTGYIRAYVGGIDNKYFQYDHVILSKRQVGSTFKPFLYTLAIQEGETPCTRYPNVQPVIKLPNGTIWAPENTSNDLLGEEVPLKWALANSNNWISGQLMKKYSPQDVITIARKMGITSYIPPVYSIALGSADLSLYEMVGAMSTFANKGQWIEPIFITRIEDKFGNVLEQFVPKQQEAISEKTAYLMIEMLKGVVESGTSMRLRFKYGFTNEIAGKTGTTQNQSDGWFMGITPGLVTGIWVGCEDRAAHFRTLNLGQGANMALPIWAIFMNKVYADSVNTGIYKRNFPRPDVEIDVSFNCDSLRQTVKKPGKDKFDEF
ncbi:MAG: transglycosylase domain-containing protein [Bacteroidota bacterium]